MVDLANSQNESGSFKQSSWRLKIHKFIFEADTASGKFFDVVLIILILLSVIVIMLDSITSLSLKYGEVFYVLEWVFTALFTVEYVFRLISVGHPIKYARSFFGIIDLLAIIPTYLSLIIPGAQTLTVVRILRVLRIFRVLKLVQYSNEAKVLATALKTSRKKIIVFLVTVVTLVIIFGSIMYLVEGEKSGFVSIPKSIYWAIVTLTTVGYGDLTPQTDLGRLIASFVMIMGYSILAVPTGIITAELTYASFKKTSTRACKQCSLEGHDPDADFCKHCGSRM